MELSKPIGVAVDDVKAMARLFNPKVNVGRVASESIGAAGCCAFEYFHQRIAKPIDVRLLRHGCTTPFTPS